MFNWNDVLRARAIFADYLQYKEEVINAGSAQCSFYIWLTDGIDNN